MNVNEELTKAFEKDGRIWLRQAISEEDLAAFDDAIAVQSKPGQRLHFTAALRTGLGSNGSLMKAVRQIDPDTKPVRAVAFNKSSEANWGVPWHQDRVIVLSDKADIAGYSNWSRKSGAWHCEPPSHILDRILFVRVHLDDTDDLNGAMEIAVGSHKQGIVAADRAAIEAAKCPIEVCKAKRGDVLVLKMLTLHASKPAKNPSGRRVLRVDFSSSELPKPLRWAGLTAGH